MAKFSDLEKCNYFPLDCDNLISIGWLSSNSNFDRSDVSAEFYEKLKLLCKNPWQPVVAAGLHFCELCQFDAPAFSTNLFIPFKGNIYVAPTAIVHYIAQHNYCPPNIFVDAVMACPEMNSMDYKKAILENGGRSLVKF